MRIHEARFDGLYPIDGYGPGFFRIGGQIIKGPILVSSHGITGWGGYDDRGSFQTIVGNIDVLFLGTGGANGPPA